LAQEEFKEQVLKLIWDGRLSKADVTLYANSRSKHAGRGLREQAQQREELDAREKDSGGGSSNHSNDGSGGSGADMRVGSSGGSSTSSSGGGRKSTRALGFPRNAGQSFFDWVLFAADKRGEGEVL
jgi:hypothetical protein